MFDLYTGKNQFKDKIQFKELSGTSDNPCILSKLTTGFYSLPSNVYYKETSNVTNSKSNQDKSLLLVFPHIIKLLILFDMKCDVNIYKRWEEYLWLKKSIEIVLDH